MSRAVEVLTAEQRWRPSTFEALEAGTVFRLREPDGRLVQDEEGCVRFRALGPASFSAETQRWEVESEPVPESDVERVARTGAGWFPGARSKQLGPPIRLR